MKKIVFLLLLSSVANAQVFEMGGEGKKVEIELNKGEEEVLFIQEDEKVNNRGRAEIVFQSNNLEKIEGLLNSGVSPNTVLYDGNTLLHVSAWQKKTNILDLLSKYKVNYALLNKEKESVIFLAAKSGTVEYLEKLKSNMSEKDWTTLIQKQTKTNQTVIHAASFNENKEILRFFLKGGWVDINSPDIRKQTALHYAAALGNWDLLLMLLENGGNISLEDIEGRSVEVYILEKAPIFIIKDFYGFFSEFGKNKINIRLIENGQNLNIEKTLLK